MCGGTGYAPHIPGGGQGLSPRVRGNPTATPQWLDGKRSIPACAGEPAGMRRPAQHSQVYPRVCGGTGECALVSAGWEGLSPRVRGNHIRSYYAPGKSRSIPACAGEPSRRRRSPRCRKVYPRVCGGTSARAAPAGCRRGLSPRVRGNQLYGSGARRGKRSIPACAGEPSLPEDAIKVTTVYPRVCGGTNAAGRTSHWVSGLSPRVRGNPLMRPPRRKPAGSIPACAGEPSREHIENNIGWVYPRVCGGTARIAPKPRCF